MTTPRIELMRMADIKGWTRNPKQHDIPHLEESLDRWGFVAPLVLDEKTGRLVAGHGRMEALEARRRKGLPPPKRVGQDKDGEWLVPVLRGVAFDSPQQAEAYLLADNRLVEAGGWDESALLTMLRDINVDVDALKGVGWDKLDVDAMLVEVQLREMAVPALQIGKEAAGADPRDEKFWVYANCTSAAEMEAIIARYGTGKGRELSVEKLLAVGKEDGTA